MKTLRVASVALALVALGAPATALGQAGGMDSVSGSAGECVEFFEFEPGVPVCSRDLSLGVDVESGPAGENPTGAVSLGSIGLSPGGSANLGGEVTCLSVSGRVAIIGFTGTLSQGGLGIPEPAAGLVRVVDAGGPNSGADTVELAHTTGEPFGPPLPGPTTCSTFPGPFGPGSFFFSDFTNATGDITVTDALPFPTTKDQCKNGGWRSYGVFRNQGDCVSFVATGAKNPPAGA